MKSTLALVIALGCSASALAITIDTLPVGNAGNPADTRYIDSDHPNGVGSVAQVFYIGRTEVTNAQYVAFLNAVATVDPYGLYSSNMDSSTHGGIVRSGISGSYTYAVKTAALSGTYTYDNKPVVYVNTGDAMRFANWLHNGQPSGPEDSSTTENGAYQLNGAISNAALAAVTRKTGARWWLPSEDEWYKAAYYDPGTGSYFKYPMNSSDEPNNNPPSSDTGNSGNFFGHFWMTGNADFPMSDAAAYTLSGGPYGTFDQGGNAREWNETLFNGSFRGSRGGSFNASVGAMFAQFWRKDLPTLENEFYGFRVATIVPEPSTLLLTITAFATLLTRRRKSVPHNRV